jgi:peptide/nickel transport system permease protein
MLVYILNRIGVIIPTLIAISVVSFVIIQMPPGDYLTIYVQQLQQQGDIVDELVIARLKQRYGLGQPVYVQYWKWISGIVLRGDWGDSMYFSLPVKEVVGDRILLTIALSFSTMIFSWIVSIPVGIYSATHQYSIPDYVITGFNFLGRGIPSFMLALVVLWFAMSKLGMSVGGLFSPAYMSAAWSWAKFVDMLKHIWMPVLILAVGSTAGGIRITRANLLDELSKPYVTTARAKGLKETRLLWKYPVRVALNPFFSTVGWSLARLISGSTIVSIVLSLQTTGPMLFTALITQDMYLAGSFFLWLSTLTVIGTLLSDILLAWVDPRIRLGG